MFACWYDIVHRFLLVGARQRLTKLIHIENAEIYKPLRVHTFMIWLVVVGSFERNIQTHTSIQNIELCMFR